ncbi:YceI family protein [Gaetbulibacter aestuarii]|uniref:YceI family protein n=1 Tax=Gaetbulibacter aestuarii TaxID=1502358 RepID=A0ABW7MXG5_9FLAO
MRTIVSLALFLLALIANSQSKYLTKTGTVSFEASVPSFEQVRAENKAVTAIINTDNGEFAALILVKGFRFKNALMEEHFNENYAESDKFPKATFKGIIDDFDPTKLSNEYIEKTIRGTMSFHGQTQNLKDIKISLSKKGNSIVMFGAFEMKASDFDIEIPKIVSNKVTNEVQVEFNFQLNKK